MVNNVQCKSMPDICIQTILGTGLYQEICLTAVSAECRVSHELSGARLGAGEDDDEDNDDDDDDDDDEGECRVESVS